MSATRSIRLPLWATRQITPSAVPVKTAPWSGPEMPTTTSSAPAAGTGMTWMLMK
ncbi:MAG TPA: hypothetical protein VHR35_10365 [Nocardioides sp.]|nr:hypothetical protein [Nocardioides sp.]